MSTKGNGYLNSDTGLVSFVTAQNPFKVFVNEELDKELSKYSFEGKESAFRKIKDLVFSSDSAEEKPMIKKPLLSTKSLKQHGIVLSKSANFHFR